MYTKLVKMLLALTAENSMHRRINPSALVFKEENGVVDLDSIKLKDFDSVKRDS